MAISLAAASSSAWRADSPPRRARLALATTHGAGDALDGAQATGDARLRVAAAGMARGVRRSTPPGARVGGARSGGALVGVTRRCPASGASTAVAPPGASLPRPASARTTLCAPERRRSAAASGVSTTDGGRSGRSCGGRGQPKLSAAHSSGRQRLGTLREAPRRPGTTVRATWQLFTLGEGPQWWQAPGAATRRPRRLDAAMRQRGTLGTASRRLGGVTMARGTR